MISTISGAVSRVVLAAGRNRANGFSARAFIRIDVRAYRAGAKTRRYAATKIRGRSSGITLTAILTLRPWAPAWAIALGLATLAEEVAHIALVAAILAAATHHRLTVGCRIAVTKDTTRLLFGPRRTFATVAVDPALASYHLPEAAATISTAIFRSRIGSVSAVWRLRTGVGAAGIARRVRVVLVATSGAVPLSVAGAARGPGAHWGAATIYAGVSSGALSRSRASIKLWQVTTTTASGITI